MTRITKISMQGFKSFAKKVDIDFLNGFNVILGPNGSGKSNVLDSICFVLGRGSSKSLRAEKSSNLIYNGGKTKEPAKQGEVSITFDNSSKIFPIEDKEVKVTRIVKQNGNSIYKLNNKKQTRQEVLDLLSHARINPDGYNIILQGDIVHFTEMPSIERRKIIEEIAGISVYEEKKERAVKELENVEQRLNDAELILKERHSYLKDLKKERDQALKFKDAQDKIDSHKASLFHIHITKASKEQTVLQEKVDCEEKKVKEIEDKIKLHQVEIAEKKKEIDHISREIEEKGEKEQVGVHKEIEQLKVELAKNQTIIENLKNETEKVKQRKSGLKKDGSDLSEKIQKLGEEKIALEKQLKLKQSEELQIEESLKSFRSKHGIDDATAIEKEIESIDQKAEVVQEKVARVRQTQQDLLRRKDQIDYQIKTLHEQLEKVSSVQQEHHAQIKDLQNRKELFKKSTLELNASLSEDSSFAAQIGNAKNRLQILSDRMMTARSKAVAARDSIAGNAAIKAILDKKMKGVMGTVAELGKVPNKYAMALSVAAGNRIHSVVVEDDKVARDAIMYLKENRLGVVTFLPLNKIKSIESEKNLKGEGIHGAAIDLIEFEPRLKKVFSYVFGSTVVVDSIDVARRVGIGTAKMVTMDGDMADISGAMVGGFNKKERGAAFSAAESQKELEDSEKDFNEQQHILDILSKKRAENEEKIVSLRKYKGELEGEIIKLEKSLHLESGDLDASSNKKESLEKELKDVDRELREIQEQLTVFNRELAGIATEKQKLRAKISDLRNPRLVAELHTFEEKRSQLKESQIKFHAEIKNIDSQVQMLRPEQEKISEIIKQNDKDIADFTTQIEKLALSIKTGEATLKEKEIAAKAFYAKYKALFADRNQLNEKISKLENQQESFRELSRKAEITMNTFSLENVRVKAEIAALQQQAEPYKNAQILDKPEDELKSDISKFEKMLSNIGAVNMKSLEIYDNVEKEYNSLMEKKDSLHKEKDDVLLMINEIESKKNELFMQSFDVVNKNFQTIFSSLAKKGDASLVIEDPANPFNAGVLIKVKLTGSRYMDIRSLSGGEKTLTALAFIFAIQEHQPHSFYVMDEVDAALDKHNSELLAKLISQYCSRAQYVVISHNDAMISEGDALFGVSMNEHGITTVTSLKV